MASRYAWLTSAERRFHLTRTLHTTTHILRLQRRWRRRRQITGRRRYFRTTPSSTMLSSKRTRLRVGKRARKIHSMLEQTALRATSKWSSTAPKLRSLERPEGNWKPATRRCQLFYPSALAVILECARVQRDSLAVGDRLGIVIPRLKLHLKQQPVLVQGL